MTNIVAMDFNPLKNKFNPQKSSVGTTHLVNKFTLASF
ncbi:hypothetical protein Flavo103_01700 [Flavobacterium collinsii]|uniref:Uncharacterized protein n=1 Tax=Flavobacterium collinsii TaxID=1114861 RepID=A0ABM8KJ63_9FLAO|nr:hypothetical protein Flavo103_01700 [Flavobacterium collinsii]CAA9198835.1 hypothetical protein FLACOL7796_02400 [Flavobacterium collinsii]